MQHFEAAQKAFNEGDYEGASKQLEKAFLIEPADALLYPWAQAERFAGRCRVAIDLYRRFLDTDPSDNFRVAAEENLERCEKDVEAAGDGGKDPGGEEDYALKDSTLDDGWDEVAKEDDELVAAPKDKQPRVTKWYLDPVGGVLSGVGIAGLAAGGALLGIASSRAGKVADEDTNQDYVDARRGATNLRNGGAVAVSVGGALLIGGVIRYVLVARKSSRASKGAAGVFSDGRSTAGITFSGRF